MTNLVALLLTTVAGANAAHEPGNPDFDQSIAPLLARRCLDCHDGPKPKGALNLTHRKSTLKGGKSGPAIVPGKIDESYMWELVQNGKMPPKKPLPDNEKALLKAWIAGGAKWGTDPIDPYRYTTDTRAGYDWWSLQRVKQPAPPPVKDRSWPRNPIDYFLLAKLEAKKLRPSGPADRRALIRRLTFDLIGLPPTPAEVETFVRDDAADAYSRLVDRLLASPHYGERWARHWLDIVRFGESNGFEHDELRRNAWPYRDWVIKALNRDMPYDEFARLQLAGDVLASRETGAAAATGFLVAGGYDSVGQNQPSAAMKAVVRQDELEDIVGAVGQSFLGMTVHCARCHDHKFDPVRQKEYYRLTAAFAGIRPGERDLLTDQDRQEHQRLLTQALSRLAQLTEQIGGLEKPVRQQILAERKKSGAVSEGPRPLARWDFTKGTKDQLGSLDAKLHGNARSENGLMLSGKPGDYAATVALPRDLKARTFAVRVQLANLKQRGGAAISLQTLDGQSFDAIVFGEREPGKWLAGSNGFTRTKNFGGPEETEADQQAVHIALVYGDDGTITAYRNGKLYGQPYKAGGPVTFPAGKAQIVFGLRHSPAEFGKMLAGKILRAELFDRALSATEVAASAGAASDYVSEEELTARLTPETRDRRKALKQEMDRLQAPSFLPPKQMAYVVMPKPPEKAFLLLRGDPAQKGAEVTTGGVAALVGVQADFGLQADAADAVRRTKLAEWISAAKNPLFARVIVNRLWHHHFGVGLVDTPNDFGFHGGRPSHPELLDWLAAELVRRNWSLKELHRLIVTSAAYRQGSGYDAGAAKIDASNRLLWRKSPARLEAEAVRDAILQVSGRLNPTMGGPGYQDFKLTIRGATHYYNPLDEDRPDLNRRSVYRTSARGGRSALLDNFDCPDPSTITPKRAVTTTPLQALALLNNAFVLRMADYFAERLRKEAGTDTGKQVDLAYALAYGRAPDEEEHALARRVIERNGLGVLCRAIFNSNEFVYVD